jgi:hypothetical protein
VIARTVFLLALSLLALVALAIWGHVTVIRA